ncbi:MAG: GGDEF domain-containing protein [Desulfobacteraceae bacterium]|nr:GGDEF domain-containing protein [Desulfobacteraceae bacterium]
MRNADIQPITKDRKDSKDSHEALLIKIDSLTNQLQMETEMRENLEFAINEITDHLFTSLEELTTQTKELQRQNQELEIQDKIVKTINRRINLGSVVKTLLSQALTLFPQGERGIFLQFDPLIKQFRFAAVEGYDASLTNKITLSYKDVINNMTEDIQFLDEGVFVVNNFDFNLIFKKDDRIPSPRSMLAMALSLEDKPEDFLILDNTRDLLGSDQSDITKLLRFREHAISAVSKAKTLKLLQTEKEKTETALKTTQQANKELESARKKMEEMSLTDTLTNLRNRRFLATFIDRETGQSCRKYNEWSRKRQLSMPRNADMAFYMLDIDHFKWVNDTFGHDSGDRVLEQVGKLLKQQCRSSDIIIRWGGEEFLIVSLNTNQTKTRLLAERIKEAMESHLFKIENDQTIQRTCSIGFACYPFLKSDVMAIDYEQVIAIADKCLYISKTSGRNTFVGIVTNKSTIQKNLMKRIDSELPALFKRKEIQIFTSLSKIKDLSIFKS